MFYLCLYSLKKDNNASAGKLVHSFPSQLQRCRELKSAAKPARLFKTCDVSIKFISRYILWDRVHRELVQGYFRNIIPQGSILEPIYFG